MELCFFLMVASPQNSNLPPLELDNLRQLLCLYYVCLYYERSETGGLGGTPMKDKE